MIQANVFEVAAAGAAMVKAATDKDIMPVGNSILAALSSLSYVGSISTGEVTYGDMLQKMTQDDVEAPSEHSLIIGNEIDRLIPLVSGHISFTRNVVRPKIRAFMENYSAVKTSVESINPMEDFNIIQVKTPTPLLNEDLVALVSQFADKNMPAPSPLGRIPSVSVEQLLRAMTVSSTRVNDSIKQWMLERGDEWLMGVWEYYFSVPDDLTMRNSKFEGGYNGIVTQNVYSRLDTCLALFLISRGLMEEPLDAVGVDISTWRQVMDSISRYSGNLLLNALELVNTNRDRNLLILSIGKMGREITVDAQVYEAFIEQGGTYEDILGASMSNASMIYTLQDLKDEGEKFRNIWKTKTALSVSELETRAVARLREAAIGSFIHACDEMEDDERDFLRETGNSKEQMIKQATKAVQMMSFRELKDEEDVAVKLIAGIRFSHTPAQMLLTDIRKAEEAGCTDPQEAAAIAAINYICTYVAGQLAIGTL